MKVYRIYNMNVYVFYDGTTPIVEIKEKRLVKSFTNKRFALNYLSIVRENIMENREHVNYDVVDGMAVATDKHSHFYYIEEDNSVTK